MQDPGKGKSDTEEKEESVLQGQRKCGVSIKIGKEGDTRADLGDSGCLLGSQDGGEAVSFKGGSSLRFWDKKSRNRRM